MDKLIAQAPEIIAIIGGIMALFAVWSNVNKNRAATKKTIVDTANAAVSNLVDPLNERVDQLEASEAAKILRIDQLETALEDLTFEHYRFYLAVVILTDQLEESGIPPLVRHEELAAWDSKDLAAIAKERGIKLPRGVRHYHR